MPGSLASVEVDIFEVEGVDVARNISEESEADVDTQVCAAPGHHCYSHGRHC